MANNEKLELLAPAGNMDKLKTALLFGADAVYAGIPDFSLRVRINDFDLAKLREASFYCRRKGKKLYVTVNIFAHNSHLEKLAGHIKALKDLKADALIISDPGIITAVKELWPEAVIHLSTQANCINWRAARFWRKAGVKRIILGRETPLSGIKLIKEKNPGLELEYFVHGAMCMAYSGRCFLSKQILGRSGNLGDCAQPCRWKWQNHITAENHPEEFELVEEPEGSYLLNSRDLCLIRHIKDLAEAGVSSFKIEGRAKSIYYQAVVCGIYSRAIHGLKHVSREELDYYCNELETKLVHRGYTTGFLLEEKAGQNIEKSHFSSSWEFCGVVEGNGPRYALVKTHNSIKTGDKIEIVMPEYDIIEMQVEKLVDPETGSDLSEAHGGQGRRVRLQVPRHVPEGSVIRRKNK